MPDFIRLPDCVINLSQIRMVEFEGNVVVIHWANHDKHLVLRGEDGSFLLDALERRYGVMTDINCLYSPDSNHCNGAKDLDNIFTTA